MSKKSLAMQIPPSSHTDRPGLHDLLTINLSDPKMWYNIGLELGLTVSALNAIKTKHSKPQPCKRAMFKEWMSTCPPETCTWSHLIPAIRRVDPKTAEVISETVAREALSQSDHPRTSLFPLQKSERDEASISTASLPPSLIGSRRERPWTDIVQDPTASLPVHKAAEQRLSMGDMKSGGRTEDDYCPLLRSYRDDQSRESRSQSSHGSGETRSVSAEEYQTAGEDDSIQPFVTYQQDEQRITSGASRDPVVTKLIDSVKSGSTEVIKVMIERGEVTPRTRLPGNKSLLMYATFRDSKGLVEYLLRVEGFNSLTDTDENGAMTLYFAVSEGLFEIAKILVNQHVRRGLGLNHFIKGTPLLLFPAAKGFSMICELLLENRADPNLKNRDGETALIVSAYRGHKGVVQVLLKFNADIDTVSRKSSRTALEEALHLGHVEVTKLLMRASSTAKENNLKLFSCKTREEISQLIKAGAKVNTRHGDETTPIMLHAQRGSIDLVLELLYHHANVNLQDEAGETALMKASAFGQVEVVDALIEAGTIINLNKTNGHTALAVAVLNQQLRIINKLLLAGADPTIKDKNGHSIEELARATNNQDIIEAIRRSRSTLKQDGQFIDLLLSYLQKGDEASAAKKEVHPQPAPKVKEKSDSAQLPAPKADQSKKLFQEAMQGGYVVLRTTVLLLIGVAGAGKTCFCHMLFDEPPPSLRISTPLAKSSIRANSSVRGKGLSFERATMSHREGAVFWERISVEMFNSLIAEGIKSFKPGTNPGAIAEYLPVLLSASEDLQPRVVPPIEHTISTHEMYSEMDRAETAMVSRHAEVIAVSHPQLSDVDQLFEMESVKQLLDMISQSKGSVELLRREWLYIIDSGGQPQFHELLPTFVRHVSAVAFFVKLNETLATRPMIEYYSKGGCLCEPYQSSQTNLQIIQNCLQAMQARCLIDNAAKCPELFFIGTHYDLESQEEPLSDKNAQLFAILHQHDIFRKHLAYNSLGSVDQLLYPVNAQTPSAADKQVVASFRQDIIEKCQKHERQIPIRWFVLESLLQELSQHGIISFKKCLEVAGRLGMDEDRLRAAIKYLAQLNIFEFYPSVLPKVVFTTSQVLLTKITELVEYSHLLRNRSVAHCSSDDKEFRDNGYLNVKFLEHERFSSHFVSGLFEVKDLLALLEDRLVITRQGPDKFMMMAVLSELPSEKLEEHRLAISKSSTHIPIIVHYPGSLFPAGIFTSLVSHLQTSSNWTVFMNDQTGKPECLFKNCVDFMIDTEKLNAFTTLIYTHQWIELHIQIDGDQQPCNLKRMLFDGLKHAAEVQKYTNITPELAFLCPHEQGASSQAAKESQPLSPQPHLATITRNKQRLRCKVDKRISYKLKEKYAIWIASGEPVTETYTRADYENRQLTISDLPQVFKSVFDARAKWCDIGLELKIDPGSLDAIEKENPRDVQGCLREVLKKWLRRSHPKPTQGALMKALESPLVGEGLLASMISCD